MAVLTMPIIGALAIIINIPSREIVNSYLYGMNIMFFLSPTGCFITFPGACECEFKSLDTIYNACPYFVDDYLCGVFGCGNKGLRINKTTYQYHINVVDFSLNLSNIPCALWINLCVPCG